jgi:RNA polymerase sigma-70 factor (ECF subfamily)
MDEHPPARGMQREPESRVSTNVDEALRAARTFEVGIEDIVPVGRGRAALVDDVVWSAWSMYERELFSYALRATRDHEAAADLVQDAFLRLLGEIRAGHRPDQVRPWLYRVLTNRIISRGRHVSVVDRWFRNLRPAERVEPSPESAAIADETRSELERAIARLPPDARVAILLAANGFSGPEIAAQLGRTPVAARTLLCRARMQVRAFLEQALRDG